MNWLGWFLQLRVLKDGCLITNAGDLQKCNKIHIKNNTFNNNNNTHKMKAQGSQQHICNRCVVYQQGFTDAAFRRCSCSLRHRFGHLLHKNTLENNNKLPNILRKKQKERYKNPGWFHIKKNYLSAQWYWKFGRSGIHWHNQPDRTQCVKNCWRKQYFI